MSEHETGIRFGTRTMILRRRFLMTSSAVALGGLFAACDGSGSAADRGAATPAARSDLSGDQGAQTKDTAWR